MRKAGLPPFAWPALGLLAVSAMLLTLGQRETRPFPAVDSYAPSGSSALRELLLRQGYSVVLDQSSDPDLRSGDLAILFELSASFDPLGQTKKHPTEDRILKKIEGGANAIVLPLSTDFAGESLAVSRSGPLQVSFGGKPLKITAASNALNGDMSDVLLPRGISARLGTAGTTAFATGVKLGSGTALILSDGLAWTNRFIDKADNAAFLSALIAGLQQKGGRIVFAEASFGNGHERSLVESIGPWANAAWQQLLFLAIVVVFTLGKRFGLPGAERNGQQGGRELADAIGQTMLRSHDKSMALRLVYARSDTEIRSAYRIPKDTPPFDRDQRIPAGLRDGLHSVESAIRSVSLSENEAVHAIDRLTRAMREAGLSKRGHVQATMAP